MLRDLMTASIPLTELVEVFICIFSPKMDAVCFSELVVFRYQAAHMTTPPILTPVKVK
jgi:hypothetical protein